MKWNRIEHQVWSGLMHESGIIFHLFFRQAANIAYTVATLEIQLKDSPQLAR